MKRFVIIISILFATLNVNAFNNVINFGIFVPECICCEHIDQYRWFEQYNGLQIKIGSTDDLKAYKANFIQRENKNFVP